MKETKEVKKMEDQLYGACLGLMGVVAILFLLVHRMLFLRFITCFGAPLLIGAVLNILFTSSNVGIGYSVSGILLVIGCVFFFKKKKTK